MCSIKAARAAGMKVPAFDQPLFFGSVFFV